MVIEGMRIWGTSGWAGLALLVAASIVTGACGDGGTGLQDTQETLLLAVDPAGGSTNVDRNAQIVITFSHPMQEGMENFADVHEGHVEGALVAGTWSWNEARTELTFNPDVPFQNQTMYVIHIGGGMQDEGGHHINYEEHGIHYGGAWMTEEMHQGGQHGYGGGHGGMGGGMGMGTGWTHPTNGSYGMVFTFTTA